MFVRSPSLPWDSGRQGRNHCQWRRSSFYRLISYRLFTKGPRKKESTVPWIPVPSPVPCTNHVIRKFNKTHGGDRLKFSWYQGQINKNSTRLSQTNKNIPGSAQYLSDIGSLFGFAKGSGIDRQRWRSDRTWDVAKLLKNVDKFEIHLSHDGRIQVAWTREFLIRSKGSNHPTADRVKNAKNSWIQRAITPQRSWIKRSLMETSGLWCKKT